MNTNNPQIDKKITYHSETEARINGWAIDHTVALQGLETDVKVLLQVIHDRKTLETRLAAHALPELAEELQQAKETQRYLLWNMNYHVEAIQRYTGMLDAFARDDPTVDDQLNTHVDWVYGTIPHEYEQQRFFR